MTNYWLGRLLPDKTSDEKHGHKALQWLKKYGYWSLFFSWLPVIGGSFVFGSWLAAHASLAEFADHYDRQSRKIRCTGFDRTRFIIRNAYVQKWILGVALFSLVGCGTQLAQKDAAPELPEGVTFIEQVTGGQDEPVIPYTKYTLENGLTVLLHEDKSDPLVHVDMTYHVGSAREELGKSGFAHFFEHMMFQGV